MAAHAWQSVNRPITTTDRLHLYETTGVHEGKQDLPAAVRDLIRPAEAEAFSLKPFSRRSLKVRPSARSLHSQS